MRRARAVTWSSRLCVLTRPSSRTGGMGGRRPEGVTPPPQRGEWGSTTGGSDPPSTTGALSGTYRTAARDAHVSRMKAAETGDIHGHASPSRQPHHLGAG